MQRAFLLALLLVGTALAGCLGGDDDGDAEDRVELKNRATVSDRAGGIEGVVTDPAVQPVVGAEVLILETSARTTTAADGSYAFSNVVPSTYTLQFTAGGFVGTEKEVTVMSGQVSITDAILPQVPSTVPFMQQREFTGFVECSVATPVVLFAACAVPNIFFENATNDRFIFTWDVEPEVHQIVTELQWTSNQPTGANMFMVIEPAGLSNEDQTFYAEDAGPSSLVLNIPRAKVVDVDANLTAICNGDLEPQGALASSNPEDYCRPSLIEEGGALHARLFISGMDEAAVGATFQQEYHFIVTMFHHAPACPEYSVFIGNLCEQGATAVDGQDTDATDPR